jgi:hypothetical protein
MKYKRDWAEHKPQIDPSKTYRKQIFQVAVATAKYFKKDKKTKIDH